LCKTGSAKALKATNIEAGTRKVTTWESPSFPPQGGSAS